MNQDYEIFNKSKIYKCMESGTEFFIADMEKKKIYSSDDLRIREIDEKINDENTFVFKGANYGSLLLRSGKKS